MRGAKLGQSTFVAKGELPNALAAEDLGVILEQFLHVGRLQARGAAVQAKLADEAVLLDHADRKRGVVRDAAELLLKADEETLASGEDEDLLQVADVVAANAGREHALLLLGRHFSGESSWRICCLLGGEPHEKATRRRVHRKALWGSSELGALFEDYVANLDLPISELFDSGATLHVTDPGVPRE